MTNEPLSGFGGLEGIGDAKDVRAREKTTLDLLSEIGSKIVNQTFALDYSSADDINDEVGLNHFFNELYAKLKCNELSNVVLTESDLLQFIDAEINHDYDDTQYIALGIYSGVLLHILTERNAMQGKRTRIHIDGKGSYFPYLFSFAKTVDELFIANFKGNAICSYVGSNNGNAEKVVLMNIKGEDTAFSCASEKGNIGSLIVLNTEGVDTARAVAFNGAADFVCVVGNRGEKAANWIGSHEGNVDLVMIVDTLSDKVAHEIADMGGKLNQLIIADNESDSTGEGIANNNGYVGCVIIEKNDGRRVLQVAAEKQGTIDLAVVWDNNCESVARGAGNEGGIIKKLVVYDNHQLGAYIHTNRIIVTKSKAEAYYGRIKCVYPVERMVSLCQSMKEQQQPDAVSRLASEVYALHTANYQHLKEFGVNAYAHGAGK